MKLNKEAPAYLFLLLRLLYKMGVLVLDKKFLHIRVVLLIVSQSGEKILISMLPFQHSATTRMNHSIDFGELQSLVVTNLTSPS